MNRYLLAGSAVVALALGAGSANAQGKFEVRMGGDAVFEAHFVDQDRDSGARGSEFLDRFRLNITAMAKADNGLTYGGRIRLRSTGGTGNNATDTDRAYIQVGGGFGTVRMGTMNSYSDDAGAVYWPIAFQTGPLLLNAQGVAVASASTEATAITGALTPYSLLDNTNATKVYYASPRFSGFQLGATFTPRSDSSGTNVNRADSAIVGTGTPAYENIWEVGLNYKGEFSGVGVQFGAGYMGGASIDSANTAGSVTNAHEDLSAWQVGGQVSYAGFSVGVGYINKGDSGLVSSYGNKEDLQVFGVGAQYATGPLTVGVSYTYGEGNGFNAASRQTVASLQPVSGRSYAGAVEQEQWAVAVLYAVAPGLLVGAEYNYIDADAPNLVGGANYDDKANVFILRSALVF